MLISVVITTFNRREALSACLASVLDQDLGREAFEVIVVVDGSEDGTGEWLMSSAFGARLTMIEQVNKGPAAARNAGALAARGDVLLFLDDDMLCGRGTLAAHLAAHHGPIPRVAFGQTRSAASSMPPGFAGLMLSESFDRYYARLDVDVEPRWPEDAWTGPNCSMPRRVFLDAGGYDEQRFPRRMEDLDLGLRLWKTGLAFEYVPTAVCRHRMTKPDEQCLVDAEHDGAGTVAICRRHPEYRAYASLPGLASPRRWKQWTARAIAHRPWFARSCIDAGRWLMDLLPDQAWTRSANRRLFEARRAASFLSGACAEAGSWEGLQKLFGLEVAVLLYHHIGTPCGTSDPSVTISPESLDRHLGWLRARRYSGITPSQWLEWKRHGTPLPDRAVMLTFDDGYGDFTRNALPILEKHGFNATQFVITGLQGGTDANWEGRPVMSAEQIRACHRRGIEIGGHSREHPDLTAVPAWRMDDEISGTKQDLQVLGIQPVSFAYPFGFHNEAVRARVGRDFQLAFTCDEGINHLRSDPLAMRRTMVEPGDTLLDIEFRAALGWSPLNRLRSVLRLRSRARGAWRRISRLALTRRHPA